MEATWKKLFWFTFALFLISNAYWLYSTFDNAISHAYYASECEACKKDVVNLQKIFQPNSTKEETINFLKAKNIEYETVEKGMENILVFKSFELVFNQNGQLKDNKNQNKNQKTKQ